MISASVVAPQKLTLETNFLNLENRSLSTTLFLNSNFKDILVIPLLNNLFISFHNLFIPLIELKNIH